MKKLLFTTPKARLLFAMLLLLLGSVLKAQTPLVKYIKSNKYEPFTIPRSNWGVGTVITINKGKEEIVALNNQCLKAETDTASVTLPDYSYDITNQNSFELNLAQLFGGKLNIGAAFNNKRIKKVVITTTGAQETIIPTIEVDQKMEDFGKTGNSLCLKVVTGKKNLVITRTLSIGTLSYSFIDTSGVKIALTADFLKNIGMKDTVAHKYEGKTSLDITKRAYLGYRVTRFKGVPGLVKTVLTATELQPADVEELKRKSKVVHKVQN